MSERKPLEKGGPGEDLARAFLDGRLGSAHPQCDEKARELAAWALAQFKSEAEWKRKAARRSEHVADLLDKIGNLKYELRQLEMLLAWVVRTEVPLEEIRRVVAERIPQRLAREPDLGRTAVEGGAGPKYLPTWAYLVTFAMTAAVVVGIAWAVAWGWGR